MRGLTGSQAAPYRRTSIPAWQRLPPYRFNEQIILIVESGPPPEWEESYISYMEALRHSNSYIRETIVVAGMIRDGADPGEARDSADGLKNAAEELVRQSQQSRP